MEHAPIHFVLDCRLKQLLQPQDATEIERMTTVSVYPTGQRVQKLATEQLASRVEAGSNFKVQAFQSADAGPAALWLLLSFVWVHEGA